MSEIHIGGAVYRVDDLIELLEYRLQTNTETDDEYDFYTAFRRDGASVFINKRYTRVILGLLGGAEDR